MNISKLDDYIRGKEGLSPLTRGDIERMQLLKLNNVLRREKARGGFYGGLPESVSSLEELRSLPFTTPEQLSQSGGSMLLLSQTEISRVITDTTSGTTGCGKRVFYTAEDCENTVGFFAAGLSELIFPESCTLICMPFSGPHGLGDLIVRAVERLGAKPIRAGAGLKLGEYGELLEKERPDTFVGMPVQLLSILRFCGKGTLRRALVSGDACPEAVLSLLEGYGLELFPHYGSREMALGGAVTCPAHEGMHLRENHVIAEIIGADGAPLPEGERGELVITTVGMGAMPLIRYRTGDAARILPGVCPCGSALKRLDCVGRGDNPMEVLDSALFGLENLVDYSVSLSGGGVVLDALTAGNLSPEEIAGAARELFPGIIVRVRARTAAGGDRLLYQGKRRINLLQQGGAE